MKSKNVNKSSKTIAIKQYSISYIVSFVFEKLLDEER
jgi:hypothetical protein